MRRLLVAGNASAGAACPRARPRCVCKIDLSAESHFTACVCRVVCTSEIVLCCVYTQLNILLCIHTTQLFRTTHTLHPHHSRNSRHQSHASLHVQYCHTRASEGVGSLHSYENHKTETHDSTKIELHCSVSNTRCWTSH